MYCACRMQAKEMRLANTQGRGRGRRRLGFTIWAARSLRFDCVARNGEERKGNRRALSLLAWLRMPDVRRDPPSTSRREEGNAELPPLPGICQDSQAVPKRPCFNLGRETTTGWLASPSSLWRHYSRPSAGRDGRVEGIKGKERRRGIHRPRLQERERWGGGDKRERERVR